MNYVFKKPKGLKFTDLAIWIDNNFYKPNCDYEKAYEYMYILAYMLACKSKYFHNTSDYQGYAAFLAYSTFNTMKKKQIKSVLNYMKSIKYFRKIMYESSAYSEMIDTEYDTKFNADKLIENTKSSYENNKRDILEIYIKDSINSFTSTIKKNIPKIYKQNKQIYKKLYISCLLSFIDRITLTIKLNESYKYNFDKYMTFNNVNYLLKKLDRNSVILWHLTKEYENIIRIILNKSYKVFIDEVKEAIDDIKVSDKEMSDIWATGFDNETNN